MYFDLAPAIPKLPAPRIPTPRRPPRMTRPLPNLFEYINAKCREYGYRPTDIRGRSKRTDFVAMRRLIAEDLRSRDYSLPAIGRALGGRDHSAVWWMLRGGRRKGAA